MSFGLENWLHAVSDVFFIFTTHVFISKEKKEKLQKRNNTTRLEWSMPILNFINRSMVFRDKSIYKDILQVILLITDRMKSNEECSSSTKNSSISQTCKSMRFV